MKIAFFQLSPSSELIDKLRSALFQRTEKKDAELLVYSPSSMEDLTQFVASLSESSFSCLVIVASDPLLLQPELVAYCNSLSFPFLLVHSPHWEKQLMANLPILSNLMQHSVLQNQLALLQHSTQEIVEQFQRDLHLATDIHKSLMPESSIRVPGIKVTSKYLPAAGLGGDYFDVFEFHNKKKIGLLIADSKSHGMAAALLSVLLKIRLDDLKGPEGSPESIVQHLNTELFKLHQSQLPGLDLFFGVLDRSSLVLDYVSAGNLKPLLWRSQILTELPFSNFPALGVQNSQAFLSTQFQLFPGDLLFCHTDGLAAPLGITGAPLKDELTTLFQSAADPNPLHYQNEILARITRFKESASDIPDDITLVQLFIEPTALYLTQSK